MTLLLASFVLSACWLALWRLTTNPTKVTRVTDLAVGHFLEIGIYKDDPPVMLKCLGQLFGVSGKLFRLLLPACLLFLLPCLLIVPFLAASYQWRPFEVGEPIVLCIASEVPVSLTVPTGLTSEVGPIQDPSSGTYYWRLRALENGMFEIGASAGPVLGSKSLLIGGNGAVNPALTKGWSEWLFHPLERPLPEGPVSEIRLSYPVRTLWVGDHPVHWGWPLFLGFLLWTTLLSRLLQRGLPRPM